jgi:hypothetical protein
MDTNQETGVSVEQFADLLGDGLEDRQDEATEPTDEPQIEESEQDQPEVAETDDGLVEAEFEGKNYKVPQELKDALLRQADYTRKTQEVAEQRKAVEERQAALEQQQQLMATQFEKAVELRGMQQKLAQFEALDWNAIAEQNPSEAMKLNVAYQKLQREAQEAAYALNQSQAQQQQLTVQQRQQKLQEAQQELFKYIPNFNAEVAEKIRKTAHEYGVSDTEINSIVDPRQIRILHDAMQWRAMQAKKPETLKKVAEAPRVVKPQAAPPKPRQNQAALDRLKQSGRIEDFAKFL